MTNEEIMKDAGLEPEIINEAIKDFQKAGEKYNGIQLAVALTILLRTLVHNDDQRQTINEIIDNYDINMEEE